MPEPTETPAPSNTELVARLQCSDRPLRIGAVVGDTFAIADAADASGALQLFVGDVAVIHVGVPLAGYEPREQSSTWGLFGHRFQGKWKVLVLVRSDAVVPLPGRWFPWTFAACGPHEVDPALKLSFRVRVWTRGGIRVPMDRLLERDDCYDLRVLRVTGRLFLRDPGQPSMAKGRLLSTYSSNARLPYDARLSAYRDGNRRLWLARNGSAAFVVTSARTERWPRVRGDTIVRTECN